MRQLVSFCSTEAEKKSYNRKCNIRQSLLKGRSTKKRGTLTPCCYNRWGDSVSCIGRRPQTSNIQRNHRLKEVQRMWRNHLYCIPRCVGRVPKRSHCIPIISCATKETSTIVPHQHCVLHTRNLFSFVSRSFSSSTPAPWLEAGRPLQIFTYCTPKRLASLMWCLYHSRRYQYKIRCKR